MTKTNDLPTPFQRFQRPSEEHLSTFPTALPTPSEYRSNVLPTTLPTPSEYRSNASNDPSTVPPNCARSRGRANSRSASVPDQPDACTRVLRLTEAESFFRRAYNSIRTTPDVSTDPVWAIRSRSRAHRVSPRLAPPDRRALIALAQHERNLRIRELRSLQVLPRPAARITLAVKLEFSTNDRSKDREAGHFPGGAQVPGKLAAMPSQPANLPRMRHHDIGPLRGCHTRSCL
jgi:hypothetical protein